MSRGKLKRNLAAALAGYVLRFAVPLATYPYLTRVFGLEVFGVYAFCQAAAQVLSQIVDFGFSSMGGRDLARAHEEPQHARSIASAIVTGRTIVVLAAVACGLAVGPWIDLFASSPELFAITILVGVAYGLTPAWFYMGREQAGRMAAYELVAQVSSMALVFTLVRGPSDLVPALAASAGPFLILGIWGHVSAVRTYGWKRPPISAVVETLRSSLSFFILLGAPSILNRASILVLGVITGPAQVAYIAAAERLTMAVIAMVAPFTRVLLPRISILVSSDPEAAARLFSRSLLLVSGLFVLAAVAAAILSSKLTPLIFGPDMIAAWPVVSVLMLMVVPVAISRIVGFCGLVPLHHERSFQRVILACALASVIVVLPAIWLGGAMGLAIVRVLAEVGAMIGVILLMRRVQPKWLALPLSRRKEHQ